MNDLRVFEFEHVEICMGTTFRFAGRSPLSELETQTLIDQACGILHEADRIFSLYKPESPLSRLARGETSVRELPPVVEEIWNECDAWQKATDGWFNAMTPQNTFDPSGVVKTWAAKRAAEYLVQAGITDFTLNAGGDVWLSQELSSDTDWRIAISKPISISAPDAGVLTVIDLKGTGYRAMATSGSAERGNHIWDPKSPGKTAPTELVQVSVVAEDLVTADVWATAAFAEGIRAVEHLNKIEGIEALFVSASGELAATDGFAELFAK
jgi:thiamine biosynthesis lipoprotein